jgi:hypothetical protein
MSENTAQAACTDEEWEAAKAAGLLFAAPGTTAQERAIHAFAQAIRESVAAAQVDDFCTNYHCAGDCGIALGVSHAEERNMAELKFTEQEIDQMTQPDDQTLPVSWIDPEDLKALQEGCQRHRGHRVAPPGRADGEDQG